MYYMVTAYSYDEYYTIAICDNKPLAVQYALKAYDKDYSGYIIEILVIKPNSYIALENQLEINNVAMKFYPLNSEH